LWMAEIHVSDMLWRYEAHTYTMCKTSKKLSLCLDLTSLLPKRSRRVRDLGYPYTKQACNGLTALFLIRSRAFPLWKYQGLTDDKIRSCPIVQQDVVLYCILIIYIIDGMLVYTFSFLLGHMYVILYLSQCERGTRTMETLSALIHADVNPYCLMTSVLSKEDTPGYEWNVIP